MLVILLIKKTKEAMLLPVTLTSQKKILAHEVGLPTRSTATIFNSENLVKQGWEKRIQ